jgi:2-polyprenyl-3-methyl-5-hydroxy-6-metoxy-1,4-benzoquinol methylase
MSEFNPKAYWERRLEQHSGLSGVGYTRLGQQYNQWMYRVRRGVFLRHLRALGRDWSGADVLDIGSGTGFYVGLWHELGVRSVSGSDLTTTAVNDLRRTFPGDAFYEVNIGERDLGGLAGRQFDAISIFDVLFHIIEDGQYERACRNMYGLLKPGGLLIASENFLHDETAVSRSPHMKLRSLRYIEAVLRDSGFTIGRRAPLFVLMNQPLDTANRIHQLLWRGLSATIALHEAVGYAVGAALYPLETALVARLSESPTTEIVVCSKDA